MLRRILVLTALVLPLGAHAARAKKHGRAPVPLVETVFHASDGPVSPQARIFLIAGSAATSAFSREIVEQRAIWLAAGFHPDQIECYYPIPFQEDQEADSKHYLSLADGLAPCHRVSVARLRHDLEVVANQRPRPPFIYLYFTSHGDRPVSETLQLARRSDPDYWSLRREQRYPVFDRYRIIVEGMKDGRIATEPELLGALRAGTPADDLYLTPGNLERMLARFGDVPKFVVLQACFSGGFIQQPTPGRTLLTKLSDVTVLTAARYDRSSFGCEPGGTTTFYGGVFNAALRKVAASPLSMDWRRLSETVSRRVRVLEKRRRVSPPSLPQFFTSAAATASAR